MFDENKIKQLQNKSHVRGKLNKEFYSSEQQQLEKKRREMKFILDQQVEERRKLKQKEKMEQERKMRMEEEKIRNYYAQIQDRERGPGNYSQAMGNRGIGSGVYESRAYPNDSSNPYHAKQSTHNPAIRSRSQTQNEYDSGDIPVMPMLPASDKEREKEKEMNNYSIQSGNSSQHNNNNSKEHRNAHRSSAGNIPLLELTQDEQKREKKKSKRNPTKRDQKEKYIEKPQKQKQKQRQKQPKPKLKQKKNTLADEEIFHHNSRQQTEFKQIFGDLNEELEEENQKLKKQLQRREEAISLLMGAVRSNAKLDRFRLQAEKILHNQNSMETKPMLGSPVQSRARRNSNKHGMAEQPPKQKQSMLPKLKLHHQSIMHDYMFGSARRAHTLKSRTFK